jgi:hypothetical protein
MWQGAGMRPLRDNELAVLRVLTAVHRPEAETMRESLDYLVVDDECDCGCESLGYVTLAFPSRTIACSHGWTPDRWMGKPRWGSCSGPMVG